MSLVFIACVYLHRRRAWDSLIAVARHLSTGRLSGNLTRPTGPTSRMAKLQCTTLFLLASAVRGLVRGKHGKPVVRGKPVNPGWCHGAGKGQGGVRQRRSGHLRLPLHRNISIGSTWCSARSQLNTPALLDFTPVALVISAKTKQSWRWARIVTKTETRAYNNISRPISRDNGGVHGTDTADKVR